MTTAGAQRPVVACRLMAYGIELRDDGEWDAALDVFELAAEVAIDPRLRLQAFHQRGFALRQLARHDDAEAVYRHMLNVAIGECDMRMRLEAQLGIARTVLGRGDLPEAEMHTLETVTQARERGEHAVMGNGMIDLAGIVGRRGRYDEALRYLHDAYPHLASDDQKDRALVNVATALRELGRADGAGHVARAVARSSRSADLRATALTLLYNLAIDVRNEPEAARYRGTLTVLRLNPVNAIEYYEAVARENATFGRFAEAEAAALKMLAVSEEYRLNEYTFRAERALGDLSHSIVPAVYTFRPIGVDGPTQKSVAQMEASIVATLSKEEASPLWSGRAIGRVSAPAGTGDEPRATLRLVPPRS